VKLGSSTVFPLSEGETEEVAKRLLVPMMQSPRLDVAVSLVERILRASRLASLHRLRSGTLAAGDALGTGRELLEQARGDLGQLGTEARVIAEALVVAASAELDGSGESLAGELATSVRTRGSSHVQAEIAGLVLTTVMAP
jgi:hypothetical protein